MNSIKSFFCHPYVSVRTPAENHGWRFIDRKTGDVYGQDNDSTMRKKFLQHTLLCPLLSIPRFGARVLWIASGFSVENGYKLGKHRWEVKKIRYLHDTDPNAQAPGKVFRFFLIGGSILQQTAKDLAKVATYPAAVIALEFVSIAGIAFPHNARRIVCKIDSLYMMETSQGNTYKLRFEGSLREKWKDVLSWPVGGATLHMPCMNTNETFQKFNYNRFYYDKEKNNYERISRGKIGFCEFFNSLKTKAHYFETQDENGNPLPDPAFEDLINYAPFVSPLKTLCGTKWNEDLQEKVSALLETEKSIMKIKDVQADVKMGRELLLDDDWVQEMREQSAAAEKSINLEYNNISDEIDQLSKKIKALRKKKSKSAKVRTKLKESRNQLEIKQAQLKKVKLEKRLNYKVLSKLITDPFNASGFLNSLLELKMHRFKAQVDDFKQMIREGISEGQPEDYQTAVEKNFNENDYDGVLNLVYDQFAEAGVRWKQSYVQRQAQQAAPIPARNAYDSSAA